MSKNTGPEELAGDLEALNGALEAAASPDKTEAIILARIVRGMSRDDWEYLRGNPAAASWQAFPLRESEDRDGILDDGLGADSFLAVSPFREARGVLNAGTFHSQINSELARLGRNGGCMSIVGASLADRKSLATSLGEGSVRRLDAILGEVLLSMLDCCDSLGFLRKGGFACCLPGLGQLGARHFAEKAQTAFEDAARPFFPTGGINAGNYATCALGIVNLMQGEKSDGRDLLKRARTTLELALAKNNGHIHQETTFTPLDGATLVQSNEKRFLFFGGDQS